MDFKKRERERERERETARDLLHDDHLDYV
jgi:hypothetical protein